MDRFTIEPVTSWWIIIVLLLVMLIALWTGAATFAPGCSPRVDAVSQ